MSLLAQDGSPDITFGINSYAITDFDGKEDQFRAIVGTSDGGAIAAGFSSFDSTFWQYSLVKYQADGSLDASFANGGKLDYGFPGQVNDFLSDLHMRPDGRLIACGSTDNLTDFIRRIGLLQLNPDGTLDNTFGTNGASVLIHPDSVSMSVPSMVLQPDGKAVMCGALSVSPQEFLLVRVNSDGSLDPSFGIGGVSSFSALPNGSIAWDVEILPNGNYMIAGQAIDMNVDQHTLLAMILPSGQLETTFGNSGILVENFGDQEQYYSVKTHNGTHILCAGYNEMNGNRDGVIRRYDMNGNLDLTFGINGTVALDYLGFKDDAFDLVVQPDGKILVALEGEDATQEDDFVCVRLLANGQPDPTFGVNGWSAEATAVDEDAYSVALDVNGKILIAGTYDDNASLTGLDGLVKRLESGLNLGISSLPEIRLSDPYPNPSDHFINIEFAINESQPTRIDLLDQHGKVVWMFPMVAETAPGNNRRSLQLPRHLANGEYFLRVQTAAGTSSKAIEIVR